MSNLDSSFVLGRAFESLQVGDKQTRIRKITEEDLNQFAKLTGDANLLHLDCSFGKRTKFSDKIVHGMFTASLVVGIVGSELPGPGTFCHSVGKVDFLEAVYVGDTLHITTEIKQIIKVVKVVVLGGTVVNQYNRKVLTMQVRAQYLEID